jgi:triosephosphate isomerase
MHAMMRDRLGPTTPLLYGGSVKPSNAKDILSIENVGGALVGGASLNADDFIAIARAAA